MFKRIRSHITYANVTVTIALILTVVGIATFGKPVQAAATSGTWFLGGTFSDLPVCFGCEVSLAPSGQSTMGATGNSSNELLSPNVAIVASNFSVHVETAPGSGTRRFFIFSHSDSAHSLSCDITGANTTCNSGTKTLKIAPNTPFIIDVANIGNAPATKLQFSWLATPQ